MNENCLSPYFLYKPDFSFPIYLNSLLHVQVILDSYSGEDVTGMKLKVLILPLVAVCMCFQIIFHYRLLQGIENRSLCHIVDLYCLSVLHIVACIC